MQLVLYIVDPGKIPKIVPYNVFTEIYLMRLFHCAFLWCEEGKEIGKLVIIGLLLKFSAIQIANES